jgi:hypothetical protein
MAVTWYTQSGTPADATGVDGDMSFDYTNRIQWGPRGLKSTGSWAGTAVNASGPTGPGVLTGTGAPANSLGNTGNMYVDATQGNTYLKGASSWSLVGALPPGPTGPQGFTTLSTQSAGNGVTVAMSGVTLSSTPVAAYVPGTTQPAIANYNFASQLVGFSITNPGSAVTLSLVNTTAGTTVYSASIAANLTTGNAFLLGTYPMPASANYQWQASGSGTASFCLTPLYLMPAASAGYNISNLPTVAISASQTFSSTATQLRYPGTTVGNAFRMAKGGALYGATLLNQTTAALTFAFNYSTNAGNSYAVLYSVSVPANSSTTVGPFNQAQYAMVSAAIAYWSVTGTGTGTCFADSQVLYAG